MRLPLLARDSTHSHFYSIVDNWFGMLHKHDFKQSLKHLEKEGRQKKMKNSWTFGLNIFTTYVTDVLAQDGITAFTRAKSTLLCFLAVSPRLPLKQHQCWHGKKKQTIPSLWRRNSAHFFSPSDHLVGLVVKASASRAEDPRFESRWRRDFFGVESYQWLKNWHSSGYPARHLVL